MRGIKLFVEQSRLAAEQGRTGAKKSLWNNTVFFYIGRKWNNTYTVNRKLQPNMTIDLLWKHPVFT